MVVVDVEVRHFVGFGRRGPIRAGASLSSDSGVLAAVDVDLNRTSVSVDNDGIMRRQYVNVSLMIGGMFYRTRAIHSS